MSKETPMIVICALLTLALVALFGFAIWADIQDDPKYVNFNGKNLLAVPYDQEISSFDYAVSPSNAWINIRFEKKEKDNG